MSEKLCDVTIIGSGLVGPLCACFLARRGFDVSLYEKREDSREAPAAQGKSINLAVSNRALKALRCVELEEIVLKNSVPMRGRLLHHMSGKCSFVPYDVSNENCLYSINRKLLNELIISAAEKYANVKIYFEHQLIQANMSTGILTLENLNAREKMEVKSDFIIGADGAHSTLRNLMQHTPLFSTSQTYIQHGYAELSINPYRGKSLAPNFLHIWPREEFMMIALPNLDGSWTVTLFMPFERFDDLVCADSVSKFFTSTFPDAVELLGGPRKLISDYLKLKPRSLMTVTCDPFHVGDKAVLIGDAAHAMVPFYGQGMNAGFEDCSILDEILERCGNNVATAVKEFTNIRKADAHAICHLSMYNYKEMRELVLKTSYRLRKTLDDYLYRNISKKWTPLYTSVSFTNIPYQKCLENREWQNKMLQNITFGFSVFVLTLVLTIYY